ncbi:MAG: cytochrome P450 [Castellaniella sp.]|uniref:cytochrome P450/oxidoreductase n=1 Tax=Castellaniella sp. TaxID=1955812 RepID=UPI00121DF862|nr:cytochrome P450/oxidoreductase [Castellaniella sp.]TAN28044.1 MAG: cytochrome P450 [Castellaniella sp.]
MTQDAHDFQTLVCPVAHHQPPAAQASGCPVSERAESFDPFTDAFMENPSESIRWAREQAPIFYSPKIGYWVVTRYQTIKDIFRDIHAFSPSIALESLAAPSEEANAILESYGYALNRTLVNEDEPIHMARRRALMAPFTPEHLHKQEPMVRRLVTEAVDRFINDGQVDLFKNLCWAVPFTVALHFLGIDDEEDREKMHQFCIAHTKNAFGRPTPQERVEVAHLVGKFWTLSGEILEKMKRTPDGPGWMRYSIRQQQEYPEVVTDSYLHSMMMAIIVAAHESTSFATANAIRLLLEHRDAWDDLCEDPTLISPAVEECLRHNGPIASWRRRATQDVELEGVKVPAGSRILMVVHSANHDQRHFSDPDFFDIRRENAIEHLSFGFGAHQCLGKNIGRMEMQVIIGELTRRLPHMEIVPQEFHYVHNLAFRGPQNLMVQWDPAQNPERRDSSIVGRYQDIRLGGPLASSIVRKLKVVASDPVAPGIVRLRLASPKNEPLPHWTPGAHIDVECGDTGLSRQYSLCGDLKAPYQWEIAVLHDPESRGGSKWIHRYARTGATLRVRGPRNHFRMEEGNRRGRLLLIAGGIGITPIMAMAQHARSTGQDYELHYSCRTRSQAAFLTELQTLHGDKLQLHLSDEGRRNDFASLLAHPDATTRIYACGPVRMLEALQQAVDAAGWHADALHVEHFTNDTPKLDPAHEKAFEIELRNTGLVLQVPAHKTVLEVLHLNNVDVQSDCEEGLCGTCEVSVLSGDIDHRDSVLNPSERKTNDRMMACCSRCKSDRLILDL